MAITFTQERKKQKYLTLVFLLVIVVIAIVVWWGFFKKEKPIAVVSPVWRDIRINFDALNNPILKELKIFEKIAPFEGQSGRENPFLPY